jgi:DNA-directed RNA polymerase, beta subunit/140 kD subunit
MYTNEYTIDDPVGQVVNKSRYVNTFPSLYPKEILNKYDEDGIIKPGSVVKYGEPLILAMEKRPPSARDIQLGNLHKSLKNSFRDASVIWHHSTDGIISDVATNKKDIKVLVKTEMPAQVGDKLTGRYGNKGVVSLVLPDDKMPKFKKSGDIAEMIYTPVGIPSRINPAQIHEEMLAKIAKKTENLLSCFF